MTSQELRENVICRGHAMPSASHIQDFSPFCHLKIWFRLKSRTEQQPSSSHVAMTDLNWLCTQQGDTDILGACCVRGNILKLGGETLRQSLWRGQLPCERTQELGGIVSLLGTPGTPWWQECAATGEIQVTWRGQAEEGRLARGFNTGFLASVEEAESR